MSGSFLLIDICRAEWVRTLRTGQDWEELREAATMVLLKGLGEDQIYSTQEGNVARDQ